jgi:hypothetical protein
MLGTRKPLFEVCERHRRRLSQREENVQRKISNYIQPETFVARSIVKKVNPVSVHDKENEYSGFGIDENSQRKPTTSSNCTLPEGKILTISPQEIKYINSSAHAQDKKNVSEDRVPHVESIPNGCNCAISTLNLHESELELPPFPKVPFSKKKKAKGISSPGGVQATDDGVEVKNTTAHTNCSKYLLTNCFHQEL